MITSVFKKSTPINYSLMIICVLSIFFLYQFYSAQWSNSLIEVAKKGGLLLFIFGSFFLVNFIAKKNGLTKDSGYIVLFFFLFLMFFPTIWNNYNLILSNFFILLAMRRLVSLQTLKAPKEKIFDASVWIFVASLFHFWAIIFILLVYISIIFHVSRDYRNWLIPFVALFATSIIVVFYALVFNKPLMELYVQKSSIHLELDYFKNDFQNLALSIYAVVVVFFLFSAVFSLTNKPLNLQASYKKILFAFIIGITIFFLSSNKSNEILVYTFFPMAVMATNFIEYNQSKFQKEIVLAITILAGFFSFFSQL